MIPSLFRTMVMEPTVVAVDPLRERWFPTWTAAMFDAVLRARRERVQFIVRREAEFGTWITRPRV